jgi:hypothetical protein
MNAYMLGVAVAQAPSGSLASKALAVDGADREGSGHEAGGAAVILVLPTEM